MDSGNEEGNGLAIRAFEAAFCDNAIITFADDMCKEIILKLNCAGTYQDDCITILMVEEH
eukprot:8643313-Ditylum_brightwellii.AAC.1